MLEQEVNNNDEEENCGNEEDEEKIETMIIKLKNIQDEE